MSELVELYLLYVPYLSVSSSILCYNPQVSERGGGAY